jgi:hypothetical protein
VLFDLSRCLVFLVRAVHDDPERIIRQGPLQRLGRVVTPISAEAVYVWRLYSRNCPTPRGGLSARALAAARSVIFGRTGASKIFFIGYVEH